MMIFFIIIIIYILFDVVVVVVVLCGVFFFSLFIPSPFAQLMHGKSKRHGIGRALAHSRQR